MRKLLKYLRKYRLESLLGPLFKLLEAGFELMVPLVMAKIIDVGIRNQDMAYILKMGGLLVLLGVVGLICSITAQYFAARAAAGFGTGLRNALFSHIGRFSYAELDKEGTATLITRMTSDANQVQNGVNLFLRLFMRSPFIVLGAMVMAFTINVRAALVFAVTVPVLSLVVFGMMFLTMPLYKKVQRQLDGVLLTARENLSGVRVIRAFNRQEDEKRRFDEENGRLVSFQVFVGKLSALLNPLTYVIVNLGLVVLIRAGAGQVSDGVITQGQVVALVNYMSQILVELIKLANLIISISRALACANRISGVFERKPGIMEKNHRFLMEIDDAPAVEFTDMEFIYDGAGEAALSGISFSVKRGQTVGIIGGTGSGKSTLVNLIPRFYDVTRGNVRVGGHDVREYPLSQLRGKVGVVPQKAVLFYGTLRENMKWGKPEGTDKEIYGALETAQAKSFVEEKEEGLDLSIRAGGKNLSGGQRQRLTIARALVRQPEILILDDSASALDFATDARLRKAIREKTKDMTVFLVSQRAASVRNADRIAVLEDGHMAGWGTHEELFQGCGVYREICLSQLSKEEEAGIGQEKA